MRNILALLPAGQFKAKGPREWAGPCPGCGGRDRFVVWPERPRGGAYMCRGCGASGDGIDFLRRFHKYSFAEACAAFGIATGARRNSLPPVRRCDPSWARETGKSAVPAVTKYPGQAWQAAAREFLSSCRVEPVRGLTVETCRVCGILRNPVDRFPKRTAWGLENFTDRVGREHTKTIIPRGIVIATRRRLGLVGVTIRCEDTDISAKGRRKFHEVPGGAKVPFLAGQAGRPVVLVESALDAALVWQASGGALAGCALMGSTKTVDADTDAFLRAAPALIASPDFDQAGAKGGREWLTSYPDAILLPPLEGKDLGERPDLCPMWCALALEETAKPSQNEENAPVLADENSGDFAVPLDGEPLSCAACSCWQSAPGLARWRGRCAVTGRSVSMQSVCDLGFEVWQAAPVELRTAPQTPEGGTAEEDAPCGS